MLTSVLLIYGGFIKDVEEFSNILHRFFFIFCKCKLICFPKYDNISFKIAIIFKKVKIIILQYFISFHILTLFVFIAQQFKTNQYLSVINQGLCTTSAKSETAVLNFFIHKIYTPIMTPESVHCILSTQCEVVLCFCEASKPNQDQRPLGRYGSLVSIRTIKPCFSHNYHLRSQQCFKLLSSKKPTFGVILRRNLVCVCVWRKYERILFKE